MKCPKDGKELSKKIYENTVETDYCESCQGVWLDPKELEKIQDIKINDYTEELSRIPDYVGQSFLMAKAKQAPELNCPACQATLNRQEYGYCSQILIDSCSNGHGIWLDKGELQDLELFYERCRLDAGQMRSGFFRSLLDIFK